MKHILGWNDWHIHPFTYVYILIFLLSHKLHYYIGALFIVCFHEWCHYIFARLFHFEIHKVEILPFGAFLSLEDYGLHHVLEEGIVIMAGLSSHVLILLALSVIKIPYLSSINYLVFIFNLLPIYPLDGSKLILILLSFFMDYQKAIRIQIKCSIFFLCILMSRYLEMGYLIVYLYLIYANYCYIREYRYYLIRLYINRKTISLYHTIKINKSLKWYRPYHNVYQLEQHYFDERELLDIFIKNIN